MNAQQKRRLNFKEKECSVCGDIFTPIVGNQKTCSEICSIELHRRRSNILHSQNKELEKIKRTKYYLEHREEIIKKTKQYRLYNKDKSYASVLKWIYNNKKKSEAHKKIRRLVLQNKIPKIETLKCSKCGNKAKHYHHDNYSKPSIVIPLCVKCHKEEHKNGN